MWGFIHVLYLIGWGNRLGTIYTWARALTFSRNRGHRLITFDDARGFSAAYPPGDADAPAPPDNARELAPAPDHARDGGPAAARRVSPEGAPAGAPPSGPDR
jgi:NADH dehydrogenase